MLISAAQLAQLAPRVDPARAQALASELNIGLPLWGVAGVLSKAHFLGQACHESQGFTRFEENLNYTHAAAIASVWPRLGGAGA
jgi:predicted chitinase